MPRQSGISMMYTVKVITWRCVLDWRRNACFRPEGTESARYIRCISKDPESWDASRILRCGVTAHMQMMGCKCIRQCHELYQDGSNGKWLWQAWCMFVANIWGIARDRTRSDGNQLVSLAFKALVVCDESRVLNRWSPVDSPNRIVAVSTKECGRNLIIINRGVVETNLKDYVIIYTRLWASSTLSLSWRLVEQSNEQHLPLWTCLRQVRKAQTYMYNL